MGLLKEILALEEAIDHLRKINTAVSQKGVDWHIDHSLKAITGVCKVLKKTDPKKYKWSFNAIRLYIFMRGSIPRGRGRAPKSAVTEGQIHAAELKAQIGLAKTLLLEIKSLSPNSHFKHSYFGVLNRKNSLKFLKIHTRHHLKIIHDIVEK